LAEERGHQKAQKLYKREYLKNYISERLARGWSPEQIAGRLKIEHSGVCVISHETIYKFIYSEEGKQNKLYQYLRKKKRFRKPQISRKNRGIIPNRVSISERPKEVEGRKTFGHWEGDLMFGCKQKDNLITLRERKSRYIIAIKNANKKAEETAKKIIKNLKKLKEYILSLTLDNGREFSEHEAIKKALSISTYFCEPYKSYQKGSVENGNGILREYFPRGTDLSQISQKDIGYQIRKINNRPMKCLHYKTPREIFMENIRACN
jgi:IS30 family transposase